eukprot:FR737858.1.p1 GENE.FR737858.1~~FR737858.1.p1  ORF type:complete len:298 (+),score=24.31 FR737858.1:65-958(+)
MTLVGVSRRLTFIQQSRTSATVATAVPSRSAPNYPPTKIALTGDDHTQPRGFYKRSLPEGLVSYSSAAGKKLFDEAFRAGHLESYFPLSEQFITQNEPAFCGLGSLAMVLNALKVDPLRQWKGPWRWFTEETLECCCRSLDVIRQKGITLDEFQEIAHAHGATAPVFRPGIIDEDVFRRDIIRSVSGNQGHMVVSFWRPALGQTGTGHFSPVAGYHAESDRALVLDVARFKYPSYWVPVTKLWTALLPLDDETGKSRGYSLVKQRPERSHATAAPTRPHPGRNFGKNQMQHLPLLLL